MKRNLFIFLTLAVFASTVFSQDVITKKTGEDISAKVIEVTQTLIKYKKFDNVDGPLYSILKSDVLIIRYENGTKDIFENETEQQQQTNNFNDESTNPIIYKYTLGSPINSIGGRKSAFGSGIASFFIPGLGQFINGDVGAGLLFFGSNVAFNLIRLNAEDQSTFMLGLIGGLTVNIFSIVNASRVAKRVNVARGYHLASNTYLQINPTIIQQSDLFPSRDYAYGMNFRVSF